MIVSVCFTNFGPYHLARLRALGEALSRQGDRLIAYELADSEELYPWARQVGLEPFTRTTLFPGRTVESIRRADCWRVMNRALTRDRPDAVGIVGYSRPESLGALGWANRRWVPAILLAESQELDHPRVWWKERVKRLGVERCSAALVGGPRHRDYLAKLGMPRDRVALGYNAVDNASFAARAAAARARPDFRAGLPARPYFIAVNRFVPEKNLVALVEAYARYRSGGDEQSAWDLVLCGGGSGKGRVDAAIAASGLAGSIHLPGFLEGDELARWLAGAAAFVHPSVLEPWGLVVNEAAATALPLLVSDRAGCVETLVPAPDGTTGRRFDPRDPAAITASLAWMAGLPAAERARMGARAARVVADWGPERFAAGMLEALHLAQSVQARSGRFRPARLKALATGGGGR